MINLILKPLDYLSIKLDGNTSQKTNIDYKYPFYISLILSSLLVYVLIKFPLSNVFSKENGIIGLLASFFQTMPGFYIAALTAIATFPNVAMDSTMQSPAPYILENGARDILTRRRFLSYMFAYLSFVSIVFFLLCLVFQFIFIIYVADISSYYYLFAYFISSLIVLYILIQTMFITFLGLWYLGNRIHRN